MDPAGVGPSLPRELKMRESEWKHNLNRPVPESLIAAQVREVVNIKGDAIRHAWHTLWEAGEAEAERWGKDHELILAAAKKDPRAIRHAGKASWNNRDFVLGMVTKNWRDLRHASEKCRGDREIAKVAIRQDPQALQFVAEELKEDPEIVYWAYQQDERAAEQYASASVFAERSFALAAAGVKAGAARVGPRMSGGSTAQINVDDAVPQQSTRNSPGTEGSQISGRLDALHSVLANHGARLLEAHSRAQALMEHLGWQAPQWPETPKVLSESALAPRMVSQWRPEPGLTFQRQLEELQRSHQAMQEMLRESKGSFNATLGDMKALWREVARLQQGQSEGPEQPPSAVSGESAILGDVHREVQSIKLHLESHPWPSRWTPEICQMEIQQLKKQQRIMETLLLTYREALSEMTQKLKEALERPSSPKLGVSLAAHARRHASERPSSKEGAKLLAENVLQFVEELHRRVRHVEDASSAKEIAEVKRQMEVLQGETLMSFHQLQQAVADLNCNKVAAEAKSLDDRGPGLAEPLQAIPEQCEPEAIQQLQSRLAELE
ncbi:unnamed protein product, partial [Durusdinium trenchii]